MKNVRAILINPFAKTVTEVEVDANDYRDVYRLLSVEGGPKVTMMEAVYPFHNGDALMVDEEGMFKLDEQQFFRIVPRNAAKTTVPLAGCGLIMGSDEEGDTCATALNLEDVKCTVEFLGDVTAVRGRLHELT